VSEGKEAASGRTPGRESRGRRVARSRRCGHRGRVGCGALERVHRCIAQPCGIRASELLFSRGGRRSRRRETIPDARRRRRLATVLACKCSRARCCGHRGRHAGAPGEAIVWQALALLATRLVCDCSGRCSVVGYEAPALRRRFVAVYRQAKSRLRIIGRSSAGSYG
jgi:hypothetical protein